jgi:hypothetical protein
VYLAAVLWDACSGVVGRESAMLHLCERLMQFAWVDGVPSLAEFPGLQFAV